MISVKLENDLLTLNTSILMMMEEGLKNKKKRTLLDHPGLRP
jgi:hypothetical protein